MKLIRDSEREAGTVGERTDFTDTLGNQLFVGDLVVVVDTNPKFRIVDYLNIIVKDPTTKKYEVMGLYGQAEKGFGNKSSWQIYRAIPYYKMPKGFEISCHKYCEERKEMTIAEIEKELGYSIKIVKEN